MNKRLNDVAPSEWDRAARSNISHDMETEKGRQAAWEQFAEVGLEAWATPAEEEAEEISLDDCTTELDWDDDKTYSEVYKKLVAQEQEEKEDLINRPSHYNTGNIECIMAIEESMSSESYRGYLKGNVLKYLWRYQYKGNPKQDIDKAMWYLNQLSNEVELDSINLEEE